MEVSFFATTIKVKSYYSTHSKKEINSLFHASGCSKRLLEVNKLIAAAYDVASFHCFLTGNCVWQTR